MKIKIDDLSIEEMNLITEALGNMPFARVFQLVGKIQTQVQGQAMPIPVEPQANGQPPEPQSEATPPAG